MLSIRIRYSAILRASGSSAMNLVVRVREGKTPAPELQGVFGYGYVYTWVAIDADTKLMP